MDLDKLKQVAGASAPMLTEAVPIIRDRTIYFDGDGLAYACAGNDDTSPAEARERCRVKIHSMQRASGAGKVRILLTGSGGHKGHRYALARAKPYQAQRAGSRRPKNWGVLRKLLETNEFGPASIRYDREADDDFGLYGAGCPELTVIATQDKDMRATPGFHIHWADNRMVYLPPNTYSMEAWDLQFGERWFWEQMLQGDSADNIPGLPLLYGKKCGPVTTVRYLNEATDARSAAGLVAAAYREHYGDGWFTQMAEQACLLWIRRSPDAVWQEALCADGPLHWFGGTKEHDEAWAALAARAKEADDLNRAAQTQASGD